MEAEEAQLSRTTSSHEKLGGWITFPFIMATTAGMILANGGWASNLIVYLIKEFDVKSIDAAQISNLVNGFGNFIPVIAAIFADSYLGCFATIWISAIISLLGTILLALTATLDHLRPKPCDDAGSSSCSYGSRLQYGVLYTAIALATLGQGGTRSIVSTMGANQFDKPKEQGIFFNWFFFTFYVASLLGSTVVVYVEDNVSWKCGFFICVAANVFGLVVFLMGTRFYHNSKPEGSPFTSLARVVVAAIRKRKVSLPWTGDEHDFYYGQCSTHKAIVVAPSKSFRFLNRAAIKREDEIKPDGCLAKPWRLCTVQEVEDFKTLIRILPLWSSSFFLGTPIGVQASLSILQALVMDRHLGPHFEIPAGSILVFTLVSTTIFLALFDKFLWPTWKKLNGKPLTPLQRIGVGHVLNVLSMAISALVESKRRKVDHGQSGSSARMSVLWLVPQLALVGIGEAFHFPGQAALYYQEFPTTLKNMATAMIMMLVGISFYFSIALIDVIRRTSTWLPDDINHGRLDNVYWVLVVGGVLNFGYYVTCAWFYKYQNLEDQVDHDSPPEN